MKRNNKIYLLLLISLMTGSLLLLTLKYAGQADDQDFSDESEMAIQSIRSPMADMDPAFQIYTVSNNENVDLVRATGSRIRIPKGSFVNKSGELVKGKVELKVREFHAAEHILKAGVPMRLNAGDDRFLESAGMIEMRAFAEGEELELQKGKEVAIDLAAFKPSEGYQLYYLSGDSEWDTIDSFKYGLNEHKIDELAKLNNSIKKPVDTVAAEGDFIFDIAGNFGEAPELISLAERKWRLCKEYSETEARLAMRINWSDVSVKLVDKELDIYEFAFFRTQTFSEEGESRFRSLVFRATPLIEDVSDNRDRELFQSQMKQYEIKYAKVQQERERLKAEADMVNSFRVRKMGVYNIDKICDDGEVLLASASFDFENELDKKLNHVRLFAVYWDNNSVVEYPRNNWSSIRFSKNIKMHLVAYLPDNKLAVVDEQKIREVCLRGNNQVNLKTQRFDPDDYFGRMSNSYVTR
jgi:hypothetical protein